jgi:hypothetical protein
MSLNLYLEWKKAKEDITHIIFFCEVMRLMTSPAIHCFSSQQDVFAYNWPLHRYREKHYNSFCHKCNHIYCRRVLCFSDHLYCNFLFLI